jgi:hypothetical protein
MSENDGGTICPRCGSKATSMTSVDAGLRLIMKSKGEESQFEQICDECHQELKAKASKGAQLRANQKAREQNRVILWKSRVNLVKQARKLMEAKAYSEAAVSYEKYLRVLEVVYDLKPGELGPEVFNKSHRSKELSVVASVYWDLFRIYDNSPRYADRMAKAGQKLALFLPYSNVMPQIVRKAEGFQKNARNPAQVRKLLQSVRASRVRCFIASAVFPSPYCEEVFLLRAFRDEILKTHPLGRKFVLFYYKHSPHWAAFLKRHPRLHPLLRSSLRLFAQQLAKLHLKRTAGS